MREMWTVRGEGGTLEGNFKRKGNIDRNVKRGKRIRSVTKNVKHERKCGVLEGIVERETRILNVRRGCGTRRGK